MKTTKICLFALSLLLFLPGISGMDVAAKSRTNNFIGLWRGIDLQDGSEVLISISDNDRDGILDVRLTDTFFSICVAHGFNSSPGVVDGPATVQKRTLSWTLSLKCYNSETNSLVEVEQGNSNYEFNRRDKALIRVDDGSIYYRVNQP